MVPYDEALSLLDQLSLGGLDSGDIDAWHVDDEGWSHLEGSWGTARVLPAEPVLRFLDER